MNLSKLEFAGVAAVKFAGVAAVKFAISADFADFLIVSIFSQYSEKH
jgi:hypothetical protein